VKSLQGLLVDLDGVLYIEEQLIPGAVDTMDWLRDRGYPLRFLTNTTMRSRFSLVEKLRGFGIRVEPQEMFSTCVVAAHWLKAHG
jgi:ribonucleotide monophosphatase NagD (HAD superfamily)